MCFGSYISGRRLSRGLTVAQAGEHTGDTQRNSGCRQKSQPAVSPSSNISLTSSSRVAVADINFGGIKQHASHPQLADRLWGLVLPVSDCLQERCMRA